MAFWERRREPRHGSAVVPPPRSASIMVTPDQAMSLAAVFRAVSIIVTSIQQLPIVVHRGHDNVDSQLAKRPDIDRTPAQFLGETAMGLALYGECFWLKTLGTDGTTINVKVIPNSKVSVTVDRDGRPVYEIDNRRVNHLIVHLRLNTKPGDIRGFGPLQSAWEDIRAAILLREYSDSYFNVGQPVGVLSTDAVISQEMADQYRDTWTEKMSQRSIAVLGSGLAYQPIYESAASTQLVENTQEATTMVARLFGIPVTWMAAGVSGTSLTYSNTEMLAITYLTTTLAQYIGAIEQAFTDVIPRGQTATLKLDALLRADLTTRVGAYQALHSMGVISAEEIRLSEGMTAAVPAEAQQAKTEPSTQTQNDGAPV